MTAIADPSSAVAASLCAMARAHFAGTTRRHPGPCSWCDWPPAQLTAMVDAYNAAAALDRRTGQYRSRSVGAFEAMPRDVQLAAIRRAQGDAS